MELRLIPTAETLTHVALVGRLDLEGVGQVEDRFVITTTARRAPTLVDLTAVEFLGSMGIGMFVNAAKALQRKGIPFVLFGPTAPVRDVLEKTGIHLVIPIAASEAEARALLVQS